DYPDAGRPLWPPWRRSGAGHLGRPLVAYYSKFAYPFANLILVLIGVPLASVRRRGGQAVQIGIGLGVAFAYLALQKLIEPFGYAETLPRCWWPGCRTWCFWRARWCSLRGRAPDQASPPAPPK
ncbi:LptF/LptG family permease, partial [Rhodothermus marinus]|uniref:LptF/LptG family permease n=1 Tax=Rhodothermus marinus TaxID=29549 RepID=UPI000A97E788